MIYGEPMTINAVLRCVVIIIRWGDILLCDDNGVGAYSMEWVHNMEPSDSRADR